MHISIFFFPLACLKAFDVSFTGNTPGHNLDTGFLASCQAGLLWMLRDGKECCLSMYSRAKTNTVSSEKS